MARPGTIEQDVQVAELSLATTAETPEQFRTQMYNTAGEWRDYSEELLQQGNTAWSQQIKRGEQLLKDKAEEGIR